MLIILMSLLGAVIYRVRGMSHPLKKYVRRPITQIAFAVPYAYLTHLVKPGNLQWELPYDLGLLSAPLWLIILAVTTAALVTGHGGAHDMGTYTKERDDETLEFLVKPLRGKISEFWYDFILMLWLGAAITIPCGIATLNPVIAVSGALKSPAYALSHRFGFGTEGGEWATGAALWAVCGYYIGG